MRLIFLTDLKSILDLQDPNKSWWGFARFNAVRPKQTFWVTFFNFWDTPVCLYSCVQKQHSRSSPKFSDDLWILQRRCNWTWVPNLRHETDQRPLNLSSGNGLCWLAELFLNTLPAGHWALAENMRRVFDSLHWCCCFEVSFAPAAFFHCRNVTWFCLFPPFTWN